MAALLPLVPVPALTGFILLALAPLALPRAAIVAIGVGSVALCGAVLTFVWAGCPGGACEAGAIAPIVSFDAGGIAIAIAMALDPLSLVAGSTVLAVGLPVLIYAASYMSAEQRGDLRRFFALMDLFIAGMLAVVFAADAALLFLGWEIIGLCSFFLIAYATRARKAVAGGRKALVMTRIADAMLLAGLILLYGATGATRFDAMLAVAPAVAPWRLAVIAALIAAGALGKSAQIPFQTWLPSAMTGPTPVSALLHSATMVAAGVILLARLAPLFAAAPAAAAAVAALGAATAAFAALTALMQRDIKKMLAYSTISQIGLMVVALGVGARDVALAHFAVHAAFKSLLFLSAGVLSAAVHGSTRIGDLRGSMRREPLAFWTFAAAAAALAGLPVVTAGWFSKEALLSAVWASGPFGGVLWAIALLTAVLTASYAFRAVFAAALPREGSRSGPAIGPAIALPLLLLAVVTIGGGVAVDPLLSFLGHAPHASPRALEIAGGAAPMIGAALALGLLAAPQRLNQARRILRLGGAGPFNRFYFMAFVRPFRRVVRRLAGADDGRADDPIGRALVAAATRLAALAVAAARGDAIDIVWMRAAEALAALSTRARRLQTGRLRDYALGLALGAAGLMLSSWSAAWR